MTGTLLALRPKPNSATNHDWHSTGTHWHSLALFLLAQKKISTKPAPIMGFSVPDGGRQRASGTCLYIPPPQRGGIYTGSMYHPTQYTASGQCQ